MRLWSTVSDAKKMAAKTKGGNVFLSTKPHPNKKYLLPVVEERDFHRYWVAEYRFQYSIQVWNHYHRREYQRVMSVLLDAPKNLYGQPLGAASVMRDAEDKAVKVADRALEKFLRRLRRVPAVYGP